MYHRLCDRVGSYISQAGVTVVSAKGSSGMSTPGIIQTMGPSTNASEISSTRKQYKAEVASPLAVVIFSIVLPLVLVIPER